MDWPKEIGILSSWVWQSKLYAIYCFHLLAVCFVLFCFAIVFVYWLILPIFSDICSYPQRSPLVLGSYKQEGWEVPVPWFTQRNWFSCAESTGMLCTKNLSLLVLCGDAWNELKILVNGVCFSPFCFPVFI